MAQVTTTLADLKNLTGGSSSTATAVVSEQAAVGDDVVAGAQTPRHRKQIGQHFLKPVA